VESRRDRRNPLPWIPLPALGLRAFAVRCQIAQGAARARRSAAENRQDEPRSSVRSGGRERRKRTACERPAKVEEGQRHNAMIFDSGRIFLIKGGLVEAFEVRLGRGRHVRSRQNGRRGVSCVNPGRCGNTRGNTCHGHPPAPTPGEHENRQDREEPRVECHRTGNPHCVEPRRSIPEIIRASLSLTRALSFFLHRGSWTDPLGGGEPGVSASRGRPRVGLLRGDSTVKIVPSSNGAP
jgi:hypothetical protein